uniref:Uncharacterized protein n=2 Tax=Oryza rufipogon TaxID=4529 RepID=A0A0E0PTY7_ORYRU
MLAFRIHDNKVSIVEKLCSVGSSGCCVGAPYNFAISRRAKVPSFWKVSLEPFPFTGASRFAVQATVFSDDLENQMEKAAGSSSREHEKEITVAKMQKRLMATSRTAAATREPSTTAAAHGAAAPGAGGARGSPEAEPNAARKAMSRGGRYQLCILSHRLQWQERVGWRIEALPEAMTGWIHDDEVAAVVKLCTASASGRGVGAPHSRAVVINKGQAPVLPEASRFAVHATVFSDDLENQMEKVKALVATL